MNINSFETFTSTIWQITKSIQKLKNKEMAKFGLRGMHAMCLFYLRQNEIGLTAAELSELCDLDKGAVSRALEELEEKDFIACPEQKNSENKRRYRAKVYLTEKGRQIMELTNRVIEDTVKKVGKGLDEAEITIMYKALSRISSNLKEET
jgi:DNA-binding MarR family transcriptional regulator